jgi:hypothetical protein
MMLVAPPGANPTMMHTGREPCRKTAKELCWPLTKIAFYVKRTLIAARAPRAATLPAHGSRLQLMQQPKLLWAVVDLEPGSETAVRGTCAASRVPARELFSLICQHEMFLLFAFLS